MTTQRKLLYAIIGGLLVLAFIAFGLYSVFFSRSQQEQLTSQGGATNGQPTYALYTLLPQDPISLNGQAELQTDNSYFYNAELGKIETLHVTDGQIVKKGDTLFSYFQDKNKYDLEDAQREQTRLYNQREELLAQLKEATGGLYNYQGDEIAMSGVENGKQQYTVINPIGKATTALNQANQGNSAETAQESDGSADGIKQQIRQVNQQIEDVEIKLLRAKETQHSTVTANFGGRVVINEQGMYNPQVPLVRIISDEVAVAGSVSEYEFFVLGKDRPATLYVNAEDREVEGTMVEYDTIPVAAPASNSNNGAAPATGSSAGATYRYKIAVKDYIQPGFSVKIKMTLPGLIVPTEAIIEENGKQYVFVYQDGIAHKKEVKLERQGTSRVVLRELEEGQQLILNPFDIQDGQSVQVTEETPIGAPGQAAGDAEAIPADQAQVFTK